jgi:hypothetical protein
VCDEGGAQPRTCETAGDRGADPAGAACDNRYSWHLGRLRLHAGESSPADRDRTVLQRRPLGRRPTLRHSMTMPGSGGRCVHR